MLHTVEPAITDHQLRDLRERLFRRGKHDELELDGLVRVHEALGRSHRRRAARARCIEIAASLDKEITNARI